MPSLDTNVLLRLILRDEPALLKKAQSLLVEYPEFAIADQVIIEIVYSLGGYYGYSRAAIVGLLTKLMQNQQLSLDRALFGRVLPHYLKYPSVSFTDCCLEAYSVLRGQVPLYTLDRKLARQLPHADLIR